MHTSGFWAACRIEVGAWAALEVTRNGIPIAYSIADISKFPPFINDISIGRIALPGAYGKIDGADAQSLHAWLHTQSCRPC
jgi:hypothetical protein